LRFHYGWNDSDAANDKQSFHGFLILDECVNYTHSNSNSKVILTSLAEHCSGEQTVDISIMNLNRIIEKPKKGEYPEYASMYINLIPDDGRLLNHLWKNFEFTKKLIQSLPPEKLLHRYAEGKWTIKEILVHIMDDERIYAYRALRFARNDKTELPGFEQDPFAFYSNANERSIESMNEEYEAVRLSTITLFDSLSDEALLRSGVANKNESTVRALGYHIAGHELHHINIIRNKYLK
jgi:uncharacterized damage-inducible protein DinB